MNKQIYKFVTRLFLLDKKLTYRSGVFALWGVFEVVDFKFKVIFVMQAFAKASNGIFKLKIAVEGRGLTFSNF